MADTDFDVLDAQAAALLRDEPDVLACTCNLVALLYNAMDDVNWLGIYVLRHDELVLGPFQGKPACIRIPLGQGVCGTAAQERRSQRVADVHQFPGHIVCDEASRSELVVPLLRGGTLIGVLDIDSPVPGRFTARDQRGIERLCATFVAHIDKNDFI